MDIVSNCKRQDATDSYGYGEKFLLWLEDSAAIIRGLFAFILFPAIIVCLVWLEIQPTWTRCRRDVRRAWLKLFVKVGWLPATTRVWRVEHKTNGRGPYQDTDWWAREHMELYSGGASKSVSPRNDRRLTPYIPANSGDFMTASWTLGHYIFGFATRADYESWFNIVQRATLVSQGYSLVQYNVNTSSLVFGINQVMWPIHDGRKVFRETIQGLAGLCNACCQDIIRIVRRNNYGMSMTDGFRTAGSDCGCLKNLVKNEASILYLN